MNLINLYSDTASLPTEEMKKQALHAPLGDEQQQEDPTTKKLEEKIANMFGRSAAMFFPTSTMCNQIAAKLLTKPSDEVIGYEYSHIFNFEAGAMAFHSGVQPKVIQSKTGIFSPEDVKKALRSKSPNDPDSSLVVVENTVNYAGGTCWSVQGTQEIVQFAKSHNLKTHLDGSRLFNAAARLNVSPKELATGFDTVTLCFSKGLCCPLGSALIFNQEDFYKVRKLKQIFGGALRQSGFVSSLALYALDNIAPNLGQDNLVAQYFAQELGKVEGVVVENANPETNIVFFSLKNFSHALDFPAKCLGAGLKFSAFYENRFRAVTYHGITEKHVDDAVKIIKAVLKTCT